MAWLLPGTPGGSKLKLLPLLPAEWKTLCGTWKNHASNKHDLNECNTLICVCVYQCYIISYPYPRTWLRQANMSSVQLRRKYLLYGRKLSWLLRRPVLKYQEYHKLDWAVKRKATREKFLDKIACYQDRNENRRAPTLTWFFDCCFTISFYVDIETIPETTRWDIWRDTLQLMVTVIPCCTELTERRYRNVTNMEWITVSNKNVSRNIPFKPWSLSLKSCRLHQSKSKQSGLWFYNCM